MGIFDSIRRTSYRRGPGRILGGVAAGIAGQLGWSVFLTRVVMLVLILLPILGIWAYLVVWAITPWQNGDIPLERLFKR